MSLTILLIVAGLALMLQIIATVGAFRYMLISSVPFGWACIFTVLSLQTLRRFLVLWLLLSSGQQGVNLASEVIELIISLVIAAAITLLGPFIDRIRQTTFDLKNSLHREHARAVELQTIMQTVPAMIWIAEDPECRVVLGNDAANRVLGAIKGENVSKTALPGQCKTSHTIYRDGHEVAGKDMPLQLAAAQGISITDYEFDLCLPDGQIRTLIGNATPLSNANGQVYGAVGAFLDITDRGRAEEALKRSEQRFWLLAESIPGMIYLRRNDANYSMVYLNDAVRTLTGYPREELLRGRVSYASLIHPDDRPEVIRLIDTAIACGQPFHLSYRIRHRSGEWRQVEEVGAQIMEGDTPLLEGFIQDISDRIHAEEERNKLVARIEESKRLESLGLMAGGIAHDFNNLLMGVVGNADLAFMALPPENPAVDHIKCINTAAWKAAELCKQMLAYSGRGRIMVERITLEKLVQELLPEIKVILSERVVLQTVVNHPDRNMIVDIAQIHQLMSNLVINAVEAIGEEGGTVAITFGYQFCDDSFINTLSWADRLFPGEYATIQVADTGCGMDKITLARIFDPFFSTKFTGRGLGMPAVQGIVRGHRGAIHVDSHPGVGTTVLVLLPLAEKKAEDTKTSNNLPKQASASPIHSTILLVDDEECVRTVSRKMLEKEGFQVVTAGNGIEALTLFRQYQAGICCIILDLTMPVMDGETCFYAIRSLQPDVPVVISSGYTSQEVSKRFQDQMPSAFLQKPYDSHALLHSVFLSMEIR